MKGRMITVGADIFGCDLVAKKSGKKSLWVQVAANGAKSKKEDQVLEHIWNLEYERVQIWLRVEGEKTYKVYELVAVEGTGPRQSFVQQADQKLRHPVPAP